MRLKSSFLPMRRAEQLDLVRGFRRGLFESRSEVRRVHLARSSSAAALPRQAAQGHPVNTGRDSRGGLLSVTFLGRARKVTSRRAAPGRIKNRAAVTIVTVGKAVNVVTAKRIRSLQLFRPSRHHRLSDSHGLCGTSSLHPAARILRTDCLAALVAVLLVLGCLGRRIEAEQLD